MTTEPLLFVTKKTRFFQIFSAPFRVAAAERACLLAQSSGQHKTAGRINDRLMLYKAGKPYIESIAKFSKTDVDPDR